MTAAELRAFTRDQLRRGWVRWAVLGLGGVIYAADVLVAGTPSARPLHWHLAYLGAMLAASASHFWIGPWPWLWTGRRGDAPCFARGLAQALALALPCALAVILLRMGVHALVLPRTLAYGRILLQDFAITFVSLQILIGFAITALLKEDRRREEAERQVLEAHWILLQGRMNPEFFLDAMGQLAELIPRDPALAERVSLRLGGLFRRLMRHGRSQLAPLAEERSLVADYLELERLRLGEGLRVDWDWNPALDEVLAPPFLLQPLVENALKHGLAPAGGGALRIAGRLEEGWVDLVVENGGRPLAPPERRGDGRGLAGLEERLRLAYHGDARLTLESVAPFTAATLRFPILQEAR